MGIVKKVKDFLADKKAKKQQKRASSPNSPSAANDEPADPGGPKSMPTPMQPPSVSEGNQPKYPRARPSSSVYSVPSSTITEEASSSSSETDPISTNIFKDFPISLEEMQAAHLKRIDNLQLKRTPAMREPNSVSRTHMRQRHIATEPEGVDRMLSYRKPLQEHTDNTVMPPTPQHTDPAARRFAGVHRNRSVLAPTRKESYEPSPEEIQLLREATLAKLEGDTREN